MNRNNNETSKIWPDLNPTAPSQLEVNPQNYRKAKISSEKLFPLD